MIQRFHSDKVVREYTEGQLASFSCTEGEKQVHTGKQREGEEDYLAFKQNFEEIWSIEEFLGQK